MLHFGRKDLLKAFDTHTREALRDEGHSISSMLLLVYGVECGLKALLMQHRGVHSTARLDDDDLTHNLDELQKKLKCPLTIGRHMAIAPPEFIRPEDLHTVFRYGGQFEKKVLLDLHRKLTTLSTWIAEQHS